MSALKRQDDLSRQRRLNAGCCPEHGGFLIVIDTTREGIPVVACTLDDCEFIKVPRVGSKLYDTTIKRLGWVPQRKRV